MKLCNYVWLIIYHGHIQSEIQIKYQGITNLKEDIEIYVMITNGNGFLVPLEPSVDMV